MSFIIAVYTNEGIIMASDSRTTYTNTRALPNGIIEKNIGIQITDTSYKTFVVNDRIGISTCGAASVNNVPIAGFIEDFIVTKSAEISTVESAAQLLLEYFNQFNPKPNTHFIVAGYNLTDTKPHIKRVHVVASSISDVNTDNPGAAWDGETATLQRLIKNVAIKNSDGTYSDIPFYGIGFNYFTLQDAINFAQYAVDATIKTMYFQDCVKTVGGPIDILAIKPDGAFWIQRKELHA